MVAQRVKCPPAMWETWVWTLGWEHPLEKEMATDSSTLAWRIPWTEEPGRLQSMGSKRVGHDWVTSPNLKTSREIFFLSPSDVYIKSLLYLFYTLIKLYCAKALSDQALSLAPVWILLQRPRIPVSFVVQQQPFKVMHRTGLEFNESINIIYCKTLLYHSSYPNWC